MQAYCMKCRKKVEIQNAKQIKMKNGKPATQGVCPKCGTKVFRIGKGQIQQYCISQTEAELLDPQPPILLQSTDLSI